MDLATIILDLGQRARTAARVLARLTTEEKNTGLLAMADALQSHAETILQANSLDVEAGRAAGLSGAMLDRLRLDDARLAKMAEGIRSVAALPDPVGEMLRAWTRPNGIEISKKRVPIGVVGIIYESRPNVTSDAAVLCTKTGNATILRGGSEAFRSNVAIADALRDGAAQSGLPADSILLIPRTDREAVRLLAQMDKYVDLLVPRGGQALIEAVVSHARMPVIKHYHGVCILYVDRAADQDMAVRIAVNGKTQRPGVCNALETLLVHRDAAAEFLPKVAAALQARGVELRGDATVRNLLGESIIPTTEADWTTEYLDLKMAVKVVADLDEAVTHVETYGSHHSDAIVTTDAATAERFLNEVDSATVYWNASTRFTDGAEFGFGAEIGISTDKLHARGPMGLEELTTYKYVIRGTGQGPRITMIPTLQTARLILDGFTEADAPAVERLAGERAVSQYTLSIPYPYPPGGAAVWIAKHLTKYEQGTEIMFAVRLADGTLIGSVGVTIERRHDRGELGYWIGVPFWGHGYATEAARACVTFAFEHFGLHKIVASYFSDNPVSGKTLEKIGMSREGTRRQHTKKDGTFQDIVEYGLLRP